MLLLCVILAGIVVNFGLKTPNTIGGGVEVMCVTIVLAVFLKATFEGLIRTWHRRRDAKSKRDDVQIL